MGRDDFALAGEFPAATGEQWAALVAKLLSKDGAQLDPEAAVDKLRSTTYDGITIDPLYSEGPGGSLPSVRHGDWQVRQIVPITAARGLAAQELERGATALAVEVGDDDVCDAAAFERALDGVLLDLAPVAVRAGDRWREAARGFMGVLSARGVEPASATGSLGADPLGDALLSGDTAGLDHSLTDLVAVATEAATAWPRLGVVAVRAGIVHDAGGSDAEELGTAVAATVEYLRALTGAGFTGEGGFGLIELELAAGADQFATISKFRAARVLLARVAEVAGVPGAASAVAIHATTSTAMMSLYDPYTNALRTTIACFAAGVGGADSVTVLPFDLLSGREQSERGRRLARNTQSILAMESNLGRVADPAAGSWYVEARTAHLAEQAWAWFQQIEAAGGLRAAIASGLVRDRVGATWQQRVRNLDTRRDPLTGVSEFPDANEPMPVARPGVGAGAADADGPAGTGLPRHRYAERFEALRRRVDAHSTSARSRPAVFLATIGTPAQTTAAAGFAKNLFEVGGFGTIAGPDSTDPAEIVAAFDASGATVACLCSSDAVYGEHGTAVAGALAARATRVYLAGRPRDLMERLTAAGVNATIHAGCDVHAVLADLIDSLGIS